MPQGRMFNFWGSNGTVASGGSYIVAGLWTASTVGAKASVIQIHRIELSQSGSTTSTMVYGCFSTATGETGAGTCTSVTPTPLTALATAAAISGLAGTATLTAAASCGSFPSAISALTSEVQLWDFGFNILNGYLWVPTPPEYITVFNNVLFVIRFLGTPGQLTGWNVSIDYEELV